MPVALIVSDHGDANEMIAWLAARGDCKPVRSATGEGGLELARSMPVEVVFLDRQLPDIDSFALCQRLKLEQSSNSIPVIVMSERPMADDRPDGVRVVGDCCLLRPLAKEQVELALESARQRREQLRQQAIRHSLRLVLSSDLSHLCRATELLATVFHDVRLGEREGVQLRTALHEIIHNAIEWGNRFDSSRVVSIDCQVFSDRVEVTVEDEGEGFDPHNLAHASDGNDPIKHLEVREQMGLREGGFGLLITRGMVDRVVYNSKGNVVTLVKRCGPVAHSPIPSREA